jgi:dolichol-phosphate mannosyltransferase
MTTPGYTSPFSRLPGLRGTPTSHAKVSIVVPFYNEEECVEFVLQEIVACQPGAEVVAVDDGSSDRTWEIMQSVPGVTPLRLTKNRGQSGALYAGLHFAGGDILVMLDGDGQNDPADIPALLAARGSADLVMGNRVQRRDTWLRHAQSRVANGVRGWLLGDGTPDTGCGIKVMHRETFMELPRFDHMHRFLPALFLRAGKRVVSVPVRHRSREHGASKYGLFDRLWVGIVDIFGVMWLRRRFKPGLTVRED